MLVKFTDMDHDAILVDPEIIEIVTEAYEYDERGNRVKKGARFIHLNDSKLMVQEEIGEIYVIINNACELVMEVSVQKKEVVAAICATFNETDIRKMLELAEKWKNHDIGLFLKSILEKAGCVPTPKNSFWYVTVQGNSHVLADAIGSIKSNMPNYANGITPLTSWSIEAKQIYSDKCEACVGMWKEDEAKVVQKFLSGQGFKASLIKAGDCY